MKKKILMGVCLCIMFSVCTLFVACDVDYSKFAGNYYLQSVTYASGSTRTIDELVDLHIVTNKNDEVINLSKEQKFTMNGMIGKSTGDYEISSNSIIFKWENKTVVAVIEAETITVNVNNITYVYKRGK